MEVKRICQWCGKPFIAQKTTTNYCSPQCSKRGYKHRMKERRMELIQSQELLEVKKMLENQEYFTFSQAAKLMGVSRCRKYKLICNILIFSMLFPIIYMKRDKLGTKFIQK